MTITMKKTLFLHHIFAVVIACSGILHALDVVELKGNETFTLNPTWTKYTLSVTGPNNWLKASSPITLAYLTNTKIVDGELFLQNVSIAPFYPFDKWEMGKNSSLNLGGSTAALVWFNITGESVKFDNGVINLLEDQGYTLSGNLSGTARLCLKEKSRLDLNGKTLSCPVYLSREAAIDKGTVSGSLTLENGASFTWSSNNLYITGDITLEDNTQLDLSGKTLEKTVTLNGSTTFGGGTYNGNLEVKAGKTLTLGGNLTGDGNIILGEGASLNVNSKTFTQSVSLNGSATIGNGTLTGTLEVKAGKKLTLCGDLSGDGNIILGEGAKLELKDKNLWKAVSMEGSAWIGGGTYNGTLEVKAGKTLTLSLDLSGDGNIILGEGSTLDLNTWTLSKNVVVSSNAFIRTGAFNGTLEVKAGKTLTLGGNINGSGNITLGDNTTLNLNSRSLTQGKISLNGSASIGNGRLTGSLAVADNHRLSLLENTSFTGNISLGDHSTLDLGQNTIDRKLFTLSGDAATIGNGTIVGDLEVAEGHRLTLLENTSITGHILLNNNSTLDLGQNTLSNYMELCGNGNATIVNGTLALGHYTLHGANTTLTLGGNATLDLNGGPGVLNLAVTGTGNTMRNGGYLGTLTLAENSTLTSDSAMCSWDGPKSLVMNNGSRLDMVGQDFWINNLSALQVNGSATINGAYLRVRSVLAPYRVYKLGNGVENLNGEGTYYVLTGDEDGWDHFDLNGKSVNFGIIVWDAEKESDIVISNGTIDKSVEIRGYWPGRPYSKLKLQNVTLGSNAAFTMGDGAVLDLGGAEARLAGFTFTGAAATVDNGTLFVGNGDAATLNLVPSGTYRLELRGGSLDLGNNAITKEISVTGNASIANGSIAGGVTVAENMSAHFSGETSITGDGAVTVDGDTTTVKALAPATPGLLKELSVSKGLIAGTDRQSSLADGLDISRMGQDLKLENLVLTANNKISVGNGHSITLNQVTIDLSKAEYKLVDSDYYFQLQDLINCTLEMDDVVFDASALKLPTGFDPAVNGIGMDFGTDVTIDPQTARNLTLLMGGNWSQTMSLVDGKPVFTALVPTPEPTTGTLSLLALGLLAARRRRRL